MILISGSPTCPPGTVFKTANLMKVLYPQDPTSIGAWGMYTSEQFRWNGWFKRYEITLDNLGLNDLSLLEEEL
jgi:hypothetical protein